MKMRTAVTCLVAVILALPLEGWSQAQPLNNWATVVAVPSGQKLVVELNSGQTVKGKLGAASDTALSLVQGKNIQDVNRSDIRKVYRESGSPGKSMLIGTGIGAGGGALVGVAAGGCDDSDFLCVDRGDSAAIGAGVGAVIGAVTGLVIGLVRHKKTLIYQNS